MQRTRLGRMADTAKSKSVAVLRSMSWSHSQRWAGCDISNGTLANQCTQTEALGTENSAWITGKPSGSPATTKTRIRMFSSNRPAQATSGVEVRVLPISAAIHKLTVTPCCSLSISTQRTELGCDFLTGLYSTSCEYQERCYLLTIYDCTVDVHVVGSCNGNMTTMGCVALSRETRT